ncbi:dephospho-CoA kinase [Leptolyngbya sp. FACHB-36]|uniref:dephospho-CoA kinase n=1 Tax=Leptolyngbya sp. FACHB-36 TaxID=2692808 RepID=UPI0016806701|nr:dephospho-CoA kinase [Leptolyngbya sp. FACHB-36]MBD2019518.1 dephospho-CoA kinase [Leptolyngbya sp. FACHB-36]
MSTRHDSVETPQRIIGLTGGVSMGKTAVSDYIAAVHRLTVLDADCFAREAVEPGSPILAAIADRYGSGLLRGDGTLDRHRLGEIIFNSSAERLWLEQQIHPFVRDRFEAMLQVSAKDKPIVLVIPLLFEARMTDLVTEIWVVHCPNQQQAERLMQRDQLSLDQAHARINSQMAIEQKLARANVILDNSATLEHLRAQIDAALIQQPLRLTVPHS